MLPRKPIVGLFLAATLLVVSACRQPMREDRTIAFSPDSKEVGFQHGKDGIYVLEKGSGKPIKVFQPGPEMAAVSTPLWNPIDRRLLFTTAQNLPEKDGKKPRRGPFGEPNPEGNVLFQGDVKYTCWLRPEPTNGKTPEPIPLFDATCDHIGYIAANLAVRWHPRKNRILYVSRTGNRHGLFEYDLVARSSRRVFPRTAPAIIFDWTPDGSHLVCVLGGTEDGAKDGIWICRPGHENWWQVPGSEMLAEGRLQSLLERLRATRPVWTRDGKRFAFVSTMPEKNKDLHFLRIGNLALHSVTDIARGPEPFRDLYWAPDGKRLGFVRGNPHRTLHLIGEDGKLSGPVNRRPVRRFAGWNVKGDRLAYTVPDKNVHADPATWALLLVPDPSARDAVMVASGSGNEAGQEAVSGLRVTFPTWSPREDKLSLWFTFAPTHRFLFFQPYGGGLLRGDPAAIFDVKSRKIQWRAVNPFEKVQIGHYLLLKRDFQEAWKHYQEARRAGLMPKCPTVADFFDTFQSQNFTFFEHHCLAKLGRREEAREKLDLFRATFLPELPADKTANNWLFFGPVDLWASLLPDFYAAEVFLSLDAPEEGEKSFGESLKTATTDYQRLGNNLVLGQFLLLAGKHSEYAELATDAVAPLLLKVWKPRPLQPESKGQVDNSRDPLLILGALALAPLFSPEFLSGLPRKQVVPLIPRWLKLREKAGDNVARLAADLVLHAAYKASGQNKERQETALRIEKNPVRSQLLPEGPGADLGISLRQKLREWNAALKAIRQFWETG